MDQTQFRKTFLTLGGEDAFSDDQSEVDQHNRNLSPQNLQVGDAILHHYQIEGPNHKYSTISQNLLKTLEEHTQENIQHISSYNSKLNENIEGLEEKLALVIKKQQQEFLQGYRVWMGKKEEEIKELIDQLNQKLQEKDKRDLKIEALIIQLKQEEEKRLDLEIHKERIKKRAKDLKQVCQKLQADNTSYKEKAYEDIRKIKVLERDNEQLRNQVRKLKDELDQHKNKQSVDQILDLSIKLQSETLNDIQQNFNNINNISNISIMDQTSISNDGNMTRFNNFLNDIFSSNVKKSIIKQELFGYFQTVDQTYRNVIIKQQKEIKQLKQRGLGKILNKSNSKQSLSYKFTPMTLDQPQFQIIKEEDGALKLSSLKTPKLSKGDSESASEFLSKIVSSTQRKSSLNNSSIDYLNPNLNSNTNTLGGGNNINSSSLGNNLRLPIYQVTDKKSPDMSVAEILRFKEYKVNPNSIKKLNISSDTLQSRNHSPRSNLLLPSISTLSKIDEKRTDGISSGLSINPEKKYIGARGLSSVNSNYGLSTKSSSKLKINYTIDNRKRLNDLMRE
ncbi:UNKNOWN [Stylonychia lemnae]|uniref:Uncharacterized protein n=1 Tax=Stylonychia lemnae TaxID=5949 RepID=A0A077ZSU9_STYLE|nr:UNKNOWN [Stylonychia lemnae]|eukprot:CDW72958.1 UNKNOWN [Stylonychia lemnae]